MGEKLDLVRKIIAEKKGVLLSENYDFKKIPVKCEKGHGFLISFYSLRRGVWCNHCAILFNRENKFTSEHYAQKLKDVIESKNGKLLSEYINNEEKVKVECENGHQWFSRPRIIKSGYWCPLCAKRKMGRFRNPKCFEIEIEKLLKEKEAQLVEEYKHSNKSIMVRCKFGHECLAGLPFIRKGWYCKICNSKKYRKEKKRLYVKKMRSERILKEIETLLTPFGTKILSNFVDYNIPILVECINGHRRELLVNSIFHYPRCSICKNIENAEERLKAILEVRGTKLISKYVNSTTKITIECKNGHRRELLPSSFCNKPGCSKCSKDEVKARLEEKLAYKKVVALQKERTAKLKKQWKGKERKRDN